MNPSRKISCVISGLTFCLLVALITGTTHRESHSSPQVCAHCEGTVGLDTTDVAVLLQTDVSYRAARKHRMRTAAAPALGAEMAHSSHHEKTEVKEALESGEEDEENKPQSREVFGIPSWIVGVFVFVFASCLMVMGFILQKLGGSDDEDKYFTIGSIVFSPTWAAGVGLTIVASFGDLVAYTMAPLALTAPLSGLTVAMNMALTPRLLGEKLQPWPDFSACGLIMMGTILTTAAGVHQEIKIDKEKLVELAWDHVFLSHLAALIFFLSITLSYMMLRAKELEQSAKARYANPRLIEVLLPAFTAAGLGGISNVALKALGELFNNHATALNYLVCLPFVLIPAVMQLNYVNRGLQLYMQSIFIPIYTALLVLANTFYGMIFYKEYKQVCQYSKWSGVFCCGILFVVLGISLFTYRDADASDSDKEDTYGATSKSLKAPAAKVSTPGQPCK
eukprot:gnl/TRDRNA2_/TRDRNA2_36401_c0_seq1.p1 gnl/TRDRNA2_/TRDRNA2_36401_c0~~gnl/TRDRNA2_/TRDRNA2_36401_c0_seq1.p1  ORF type:complete len:450 (-),score=66.40 gnl/TRDRNA2_/TRDRNA2_36401_c0_seq1:98-1447(-)